MQHTEPDRYAKVIDASRRVRWEIDRDVIRGRKFDFAKHFLPDTLSKVTQLTFLRPGEVRFLSQIQGRTYANMFAFVERFIGAKIAELTRTHALGDQVAFEALVRFTDEELKHQALFRRLEEMMKRDMPAGWRCVAEPNDVARAVLGKSTWAVLALTLDIELFTLAHYRASIDKHDDLCELWKDVFLFHWREESQHAVLDELELLREDSRVSAEERDQGVDDLIDLVVAIDGILQGQAAADAEYFTATAGRLYSQDERDQVAQTILKAYRWQYIVSGVMEPRFQRVLFSLLTTEQGARIQQALAPLIYAVPKTAEIEMPMAA